MPRLQYLWLPALITLASSLHAQPRQWSQGSPTDREQMALEVLNALRADPGAAVAHYGRAEMVRRDPMVAAALRGVTAPIYADGFRGRDPAHAQMIPIGYIEGVDASEALMRARISEMDRHRTTIDPSVAPLAGMSPPLPPLVLYPAFSEFACSQAADAISSPAFSIVRQYFWADHKAELPTTAVTPPMYIRAQAVQFGAPSISGTNATGGVAVLRAGVPPVGTSLAHYARNEQLLIYGLYDDRVLLSHAILTANFQAEEHFKDRFTWSADSAGRRTYGKSQMVGLSESAPRTESPGEGTRTLAIYRTDDDALTNADLPYGADTVFVTGVVYVDRDYDRSYSLGEGAAGLRVEVGGEWFAMTPHSGGYAIPVRAGGGEVLVSAIGTNPTDGQHYSVTRTVTVGDRSCKVDFVLPIGVPRVSQETVAASEGDVRLRNLSARGIAEGGSGALAAGFAVTGSAPKRLLIRGMAASALSLGLRGVLRKPLLTIFDGRGERVRSVRTQDTYQYDRFGQVAVRPELVAASAAVGAFPFSLQAPPYLGSSPVTLLKAGESNYGDAYDVAVILEVSPGTYSATIRPDVDSYTESGFGNGLGPIPERVVRETPDRYPHHGLTWGDSGVVVMEVYDLSDGGSRLVNLSARGRVEPGDRALIVGFALGGAGERRMLIRGVSASLREFGLSEVLHDPAISILAGSTVVAANDNWGGSPHSDQMRTLAASAGAFPLAQDSPDAGALVRLPAGTYSVPLVPQAGAVVGNALVELYVVDP